MEKAKETIKVDGIEYVLKSSIKAVAYKPKKAGVWNIGKKYFIRTVTMNLHGTLVEVTDKELVLMDAAWIADTKRFAQFVKNEPQEGIEVEPFPRHKPVIVGRGAIIDAIEHDGNFEVQK